MITSLTPPHLFTMDWISLPPAPIIVLDLGWYLHLFADNECWPSRSGSSGSPPRPGVGLVPDHPDVGAPLADDVLVELLEDGNLDLEAALSNILDHLGEVLAAVVHVHVLSDNVALYSEIEEADPNIGKVLVNLLYILALGSD